MAVLLVSVKKIILILFVYLSAVGDEMVTQGVKLPVLHSREQVRVVAALSQLHDDV